MVAWTVEPDLPARGNMEISSGSLGGVSGFFSSCAHRKVPEKRRIHPIKREFLGLVNITRDCMVAQPSLTS